MSFFKLLKRKNKNKIRTKNTKEKGCDDKKKDVSIDNKKNGKILVCDDSSGNRLVLKRYLERKGYQIEEASNGKEAIEMITKNGTYNIIWIDIQMPEMDGLSCTEKLREMNYEGVIIGLTGYVDPITFKKCSDSGMNHVISKPVDKDVLYMYLDKYF